MDLSTLASSLARKNGATLIDPRAAYRSKEQETAAYYFSDSNQKGCFSGFKVPKKQLQAVKPQGCFPKKHGFVSDAEYDALVSATSKRLDPKARGLQKLGLDESQVKEIKPISFANAVYIPVDERKPSEPFFWKIGSDGVFRSSIYEITWIYFTATQLLAYQLRFSVDWEKLSERTFEYHYKDITALSTDTVQEDEVIDGEKVFQTVRNVFTITVPNDSFTVSLRNRPNEEEENTIQAMKAMLREKKA